MFDLWTNVWNMYRGSSIKVMEGVTVEAEYVLMNVTQTADISKTISLMQKHQSETDQNNNSGSEGGDSGNTGDNSGNTGDNSGNTGDNSGNTGDNSGNNTSNDTDQPAGADPDDSGTGNDQSGSGSGSNQQQTENKAKDYVLIQHDSAVIVIEGAVKATVGSVWGTAKVLLKEEVPNGAGFNGRLLIGRPQIEIGEKGSITAEKDVNLTAYSNLTSNSVADESSSYPAAIDLLSSSTEHTLRTRAP